MLLFDTAELRTCLNLNFLNQEMHTQAHDQTLPKETFKKMRCFQTPQVTMDYFSIINVQHYTNLGKY